jgi:transcriptional regulator with XRE-family HTH domain
MARERPPRKPSKPLARPKRPEAAEPDEAEVPEAEQDRGFAARFRQAMVWAQMRPSTLAELMDVHRVSVSRWRAGQRPDEMNLGKLARFLDVNTAWLGTGKGSMHDPESGRPSPKRGPDVDVSTLTAGVDLATLPPEQVLLSAILEVAQRAQTGTGCPLERTVWWFRQVYEAGRRAGGKSGGGHMALPEPHQK